MVRGLPGPPGEGGRPAALHRLLARHCGGAGEAPGALTRSLTGGHGRDVGPVVHPGPRDPRDRLVRARPRVGDGRRDRGDVQHPPARGEHGAVGSGRGAGVEHGDAGERLGRGDALDHVAGARRRGIALGREHDRHTRVIGERDLRRGAARRRVHDVGEVDREAGQHHLALRVAEAHVVLDHLGPVGGEHHPRVEHPAVLDAFAREPVQGGPHRAVHHVVDRRGRHDRHRRVGAHAAGVGTGVAVADALEVLRGGERHRGVGIAVAHDEQGQLGAAEPLLDHERAAGVAERVAGEVGAHRVARVGDRLGDDHALARGETVGLDHPRRAELVEVRARGVLVAGAEAAVARGGHPGLGEHVLHPRLRAFEARARGAGPERQSPARPHRVGGAGHERHLGPDHHHVGGDVVGERGDGRGVGHIERTALGQARDPRVAGCGDDHVGGRGTLQRPDQRVLAAAGPDDEEPHGLALDRQHDGLGPVGADTDEADGHAHRLLHEAQVVARRGRELLDRRATADVALPAGEGLVDRPHLVQHRLVVGHVVVAGAVVALVGDAHLELGERFEHVELGDRDLGAGVEPHRVLEHHEVEPARTTAATGVGAELVAAVDELVADRVALEQLGGERAAADARDVGLGHADHPLDRTRADTGAGAHAPRDGVRRRDERIGAVVEVEEGGLRTLEEHALPAVERVVEDVHGVGDHRLEPRRHRQVLLGDLVAVEGEPVVDLGEQRVLLAQRELELLAEDLGVEEVLDAQAHAQRLVGVGGADAALGGAELVLAQVALGDAVELLVVRHDQVAVARELHARHVDALGRRACRAPR